MGALWDLPATYTAPAYLQRVLDHCTAVADISSMLRIPCDDLDFTIKS